MGSMTFSRESASGDFTAMAKLERHAARHTTAVSRKRKKPITEMISTMFRIYTSGMRRTRKGNPGRNLCNRGLRLARLLHHLDQDLPGGGRVGDFSQECNARPAHALIAFQPDIEPKSVNGNHGGLLSCNAGKRTGQEQQRVTVIGVHMLEDSGSGVGQRIRLCLGIV